MSGRSRRMFLGRAAVLSAAGVLAARRAALAGAPKQDAVRVACLGAGGRARHLLGTLKNLSGAKVVALADVWTSSLDAGRKLLGPVEAVGDFRRLLDRKDIDAVLIGTPDHWHAAMTVAACQAGKHVYVEKPLTHDLSEGPAVLAAQKASGRVVQVGMQQRSMTHLKEAYETIVKPGKLGTVFKARVSWNRNVPRGKKGKPVDPKTVDWKAFLGSARPQPFDDYRLREWRWFWDFGGGLFTDLMVHFLDVVHWYTGATMPVTARSAGAFVRSAGLWETPDTVQTILEYPPLAAGGPPFHVHYEGTFSNSNRRAMMELQGTKGTLYADRGRYVFAPEDGKLPAVTKVLATKPTFLGADFYDKPDGERLHLEDWLAAIRDKRQPTAPAEAGVNSAAAAHLANVALRTNAVARMAEAVKAAGRKA